MPEELLLLLARVEKDGTSVRLSQTTTRGPANLTLLRVLRQPLTITEGPGAAGRRQPQNALPI